MIFVDTNIFYSVFFDTEFSVRVRRFVESEQRLVTSFVVVNELVFLTLRKLSELNYEIKNYYDFRKFISERGYDPFAEQLNLIFEFIESREVEILPDTHDLGSWRDMMGEYRLLPNDALIATTCKHYGIKKIATFDDDFKRVDFLEVVEI